MGPTMFLWVRTAAVIWPRSGFRSSLSKAITEQFTVDPALICTFLFVMSLLEQKAVAEATDEVSHSTQLKRLLLIVVILSMYISL